MGINRRQFLASTGLAVATASCRAVARPRTPAQPIIDIHQHVGFANRPNDALLEHQTNLSIAKTILLPAGRPVSRPSTHHGVSNGLKARCAGNEACHQLAKAHPGRYFFAANDVPDVDDAAAEIEKYLKLGAVAIAEQKFGLDCDSAEMQRIYALAQAYDVPVLLHFEHGWYNHGFDRFHTMLERFPTVRFVGHAQSWWAHIEDRPFDPAGYPKGFVTRGGLTDRYLRDYANMFGDLSAGSGLNALTRDETFATDFVSRHQDKLMFGSDCSDHAGAGDRCIGAKTLAMLRHLAPSETVQRKVLYNNASRVFRV